MTGFQLPENYTADPEALLRKSRSRTSSSSASPTAVETVAPAPAEPVAMAQKSLREFSVPAVANVPTGPVAPVGDRNFELKTGLITMVQASPFCGLPSEDATAHLQHFLELCETVVIKDVALDVIRLRLFPSHVLGRQNSGSTRTRTLWIHGQSALRRS